MNFLTEFVSYVAQPFVATYNYFVGESDLEKAQRLAKEARELAEEERKIAENRRRLEAERELYLEAERERKRLEKAKKLAAQKLRNRIKRDKEFVKEQIKEFDNNKRRYAKVLSDINEVARSKVSISKEIDTTRLNKDDIMRMLQKVLDRNDPRMYLTLGINNVWYMINSENIGALRRKIRRGSVVGGNDGYTISSSDSAIIEVYQEHDVFTIAKVKKVNKNNNDEGAFFPYLVNKDKNLYLESWSNYGLYNTAEPALQDENNCFINSLIQHKKFCKIKGIKDDITEEVLSKIKLNCRDRTVHINTIKQICDEFDIRIGITSLNKEGSRVYGKNKNSKIIKIGKVSDHYFHIDDIDTEITWFALKNREDIRAYLEENNISKPVNKTIRWKKAKGLKYLCTDENPKFTSSLKLVKFLYENQEKYLTPMTLSDEGIAESNFRDKVKDIKTLSYFDEQVDGEKTEGRIFCEIYAKHGGKYTEKDLEKYSEENCLGVDQLRKIMEKQESRNSEKDVVFFDIESTIDGDHKAYTICSEHIEGGKLVKNNFDNGFSFLNSLKEGSVVYAHNLGYDMRLLVHLMSVNGTPIVKGNKIMSLKATINNLKESKKIIFKDSLPLIPMKLSDFPQSFKLPKIEKEVMNYEAYTSESVFELYSVREYVKDFDKDQLRSFFNNIKRWNIKIDQNDMFDHVEYSRKYCEIDVEILRKGMCEYQKYINTLCEELKVPLISLESVISVPSIANKLFEYTGCFDGVYKVSGHVREFLSRAVVGGRTMSRNNKKWHIIGNRKENIGLEDIDKVSLYPSAMIRFPGFVKGKPKIIKEGSTYEDICNYDSYNVEVRFRKGLHKKLPFPLVSYVKEDGVRCFTNNVKGKTINLGKIALEDVIKYHEVKPKDIEIVRGYYYDEGFNTKIKDLMKYLFDKRLALKKEGNPMQILVKLIMNAGYGKLIQKPIATEMRIMNEKRALVFISKNHNKRNLSWTISKHGQYFITCGKNDVTFNYTQLGVDILDMSKRIMNETIDVLERCDAKVYYTDTDSLHVDVGKDNCKLKKACEEYKKIYGVELLGKNIEQFHSDFPSKNLKKGASDPKAFDTYILGKKAYIDDIYYEQCTKEGECNDYCKGTCKGKVVNDQHVRMKGVPGYCMPKSKEDIMSTYERLYKGEVIEYDIFESAKLVKAALFNFGKDWTIKNREEFKRRVSYSGDIEETMLG